MNKNPSQPLAERMRPQDLTGFVGQKHLVGEGKIIHKLISQDSIPSMIFWGPPGSGKTTLARLIANETESKFVQLSAASSGVKDVRKIVEQAKNLQRLETKTILFLDEIHRFNKAQQDALLPDVEDGTITLVGATTENPSFEVNAPLLSRSRILRLEPLTPDDIKEILSRAIKNTDQGYGGQNITFDKEEPLSFLAHASNGDARRALNALELAIQLHETETQNKITLTKDDIKEALQKEHLQYDRAGDNHYNTISAYIKSMRAGDADAAIYYLTRMVEAGEDPLFIARRMVIFASEDIGLAQPTALVVANEVFRACEIIGYPECAINLAHGTTYLAKQKKNRSAYNALRKAQSDIKEHGNLPIPLEIRNAPTSLMKDMGYGKNYEMYPEEKSFLPEKLQNKTYFDDNGSQRAKDILQIITQA